MVSLAVINMGELGMVFPEGIPEKEYEWKFAKVIEIPEEERDMNIIIMIERLDVENAKDF